jgi:beta-phosphoglucomutase-like phosphatase (HAD superfamily)/dTDP-glucose pyrophosphorylase
MNLIKAIIFDLDGVLVDTKKIHFNSLNKALKKNNIDYSISYDDHLKFFDGLPTVEKLNILIKKKLIKKNNFSSIIKYKNIFTIQELKNIGFDKNIYKIFFNLSKKYKLAVATNAIKSTLDNCLKKLRINKFISYKISNEDVNNFKPHPEMYLRCFVEMSIKPQESLIVEDSHFGRLAALEAGGNLLPIKEISELSLNKISSYLNLLNKDKNTFIKKTQWVDSELNIIIPMAGAGKRFSDAGYIFPKPLIEINNKPMIQWVIDGLNIKANYIFIVQKNHLESYNLASVLKIIEPNCKIVVIDRLTEGAACTTLLAKNFINNKNPLIIANSDQYIEWNSSKVLYNFMSKKIDGAILTFESTHPKWSYAKTRDNNVVVEVAEKKVISKNATVGVYFWRFGSDYVKYTQRMIKKNIRVNNEFYVCPVYNEAINDKKNIVIYPIDKMWGLGTPQDLEFFKSNYKYFL